MITLLTWVIGLLGAAGIGFGFGYDYHKGRAAEAASVQLGLQLERFQQKEAAFNQAAQQWEDQQREQQQANAALRQQTETLAVQLGRRQCLGPRGVRIIRAALRGESAASGKPDPAVPAAAAAP